MLQPILASAARQRDTGLITALRMDMQFSMDCSFGVRPVSLFVTWSMEVGRDFGAKLTIA